MKKITLTCPFTGVPFDALENADGSLIVQHPLTGVHMRVGFNEPSNLHGTLTAEQVRGEKIVRCKNCKWFIPQGTHHFNGGVTNKNMCKVVRGFVVQIEPDGFCAWGERKDFGGK